MRAVKGSLVAAKPVSLSKAAAILSRFAASGSCSRRDVSAYVRRASAAFDELVLANREFRAARKRSELLDADVPRKKRRDREGSIGGGDSESGVVEQVRCGAVDRSEDASDGDGGRQKKRRKLRDAEGERSVLCAVKDENVTIPDGDLVDRSTKGEYEAASFGGIGVIGLELTSGKGTKKKKNKNREVVNSDERSELARLQVKNEGLEEEKSEKDEKKVKEMKRKEKHVNGTLVEEERHGREEEVRRKKVDMGEERHANENKKRKNKENEVGSIEDKPRIDQNKKKKMGSSEEPLRSVKNETRTREAEHQEMVNKFNRKEDARKRKKKIKIEESYEI